MFETLISITKILMMRVKKYIIDLINEAKGFVEKEEAMLKEKAIQKLKLELLKLEKTKVEPEITEKSNNIN